jgi:hypothetical protein
MPDCADYARLLRQQGVRDSVLEARLRDAGYRMPGPISGFDVTTTEAGEGLMPYVMASETWWSHVMIVHRPVSDP